MAAYSNLVVDRGEPWTETITWKDASGNAVNVTGYSPAWVAEPVLPVVPTMTMGGVDGKTTLTLTAAQTAQLDGEVTFFSLTITSGSNERRLAGRLIVRKDPQ